MTFFNNFLFTQIWLITRNLHLRHKRREKYREWRRRGWKFCRDCDTAVKRYMITAWSAQNETILNGGLVYWKSRKCLTSYYYYHKRKRNDRRNIQTNSSANNWILDNNNGPKLALQTLTGRPPTRHIQCMVQLNWNTSSLVLFCYHLQCIAIKVWNTEKSLRNRKKIVSFAITTGCLIFFTTFAANTLNGLLHIKKRDQHKSKLKISGPELRY